MCRYEVLQEEHRHDRALEAMPKIDKEIAYLREKAAQFRQLAANYARHDPAITRKLEDIARDIEKRADELDLKRKRGLI